MYSRHLSVPALTPHPPKILRKTHGTIRSHPRPILNSIHSTSSKSPQPSRHHLRQHARHSVKNLQIILGTILGHPRTILDQIHATFSNKSYDNYRPSFGCSISIPRCILRILRMLCNLHPWSILQPSLEPSVFPPFYWSISVEIYLGCFYCCNAA